MVRRRWAAVVGLVACLLLLPLVAPGSAHGGRTAQTAVTAAVAPDRVETAGTASAGGEEAGEPCPRGGEPSVRQPVARTPRAAGAAGAGTVAAAAPGADRDGADIGAARTSGRTAAVASAVNAVELQTFRC